MNRTRVDIFTVEQLEAFYTWAAQFNPKTKEDMARLLSEYKKADAVIDAPREHAEAKIVDEFKKIGKKVVIIDTSKEKRKNV